MWIHFQDKDPSKIELLIWEHVFLRIESNQMVTLQPQVQGIRWDHLSGYDPEFHLLFHFCVW